MQEEVAWQTPWAYDFAKIAWKGPKQNFLDSQLDSPTDKVIY